MIKIIRFSNLNYRYIPYEEFSKLHCDFETAKLIKPYPFLLKLFLPSVNTCFPKRTASKRRSLSLFMMPTQQNGNLKM